MTLNWTPPTENTDGSAILPGELIGYTIAYGTDITSLAQQQAVGDPTATSAVVADLTLGTAYYFAICSLAVDGCGPYSNVVSGTPQ